MTAVPELRRVGLLGGGVIGSGWAARFLLHGVEVRLFDPDPGAATAVERTVSAARRALVRLYNVPLPAEGSILIVGSAEEAVAGADFVQESAPERLDLKRQLLAAADAVADPEIVLASSTSGLRPSAMGEGLRHPERVIAGHPFNPVYLLPLVEVCGRDAEVVERASSVYRSVGMHPLVLSVEIDGFVADRLLEALWREALWLVNDGEATTDQIDDAIRYGPGLRWSAMGTFLTYRLAGGDAGMRHFMEQFGPALRWPWTKLTDVPELTPELIDRVVEQSDAQAGGRTVSDLTAQRDDCLVAVLQALRSVDWGAGQVVAHHDRSLAARAGGLVAVAFPDGHRSEFHPLWLRDNCRCPECLHPQTRERVLDTFSLDPKISPTAVDMTADELVIEWPDVHRTRYSLDWLRGHCSCPECRAPRRSAPRLWKAAIATDLPELSYAEIVAGDEGLASFVDTVWTTGFCVVRAVPATESALRDLARRVGHIRPTNFGSDFHVATMVEPNNVAYTSVELRPHSDAANCESPPGVQFLLCLAADAPGGESTLVDGFAIAEHLQAAAPGAFATLCENAIPYRFHDDAVDIRWSAPVVGLYDDGSYREIRFHNALMAPFDLPLERIAPTYAALRRFNELATSDEYRVTVRLGRGDLIVFHNRRVLHGRTAFDPGAGERHLFGLYVDVDEWLSCRRILQRRRSPAVSAVVGGGTSRAG
jgi:carnitine 3-dehydrogenase